jgi:hypothetical protein
MSTRGAPAARLRSSVTGYRVTTSTKARFIVPIIRNHDFAISHTPGSRQLLILAHGGWKMKKAEGSRSGDGWTKTPIGAQIHFYTVDGQYTIGNRVGQAVLADPQAAFDGTLDKGQFPFQQICTEDQGVKDYALYIDDRPVAVTRWRNHCAQVAPNYHADVDIAFIEVEDHKRHFSEVLELAKANKLPYQRYHAGFCRVDR